MVYQLAVGLKKLGDEVVVFSSGGYYHEKLLQVGIESTIHPLANLSAWLHPSFWRILARALQKGDYDIWHVQTIPLAFLVRLIARLYGLKAETVLTLHGSPEWKIQWILPFLKRIKVKKCAVSDRLASQVQGEYIPNAVEVNLHSLENECSLKAITLSKEKAEILPLRVLIVARLVPEKGIDLWLKAVKQLETEGIQIETWLAGEGPERETLKKYGVENNLRIHFLGWMEDPWHISREMDLFVLASRREGEPLALLEAMASYLPILATEVGGIPELLKENRGILVEPTSEGLTRGVKEFLNRTRVDKQGMLERAYEFVRLRTWEACVLSYRKQYQALVGEVITLPSS